MYQMHLSQVCCLSLPQSEKLSTEILSGKMGVNQQLDGLRDVLGQLQVAHVPQATAWCKTRRYYGCRDTISAYSQRDWPGHMEDLRESPAAEDERLDYIAECVLRTLKLKQDKWQKCVSSEDNRQVLQEFLDKAEQRTLVVSVTAGGQLQTASSFTGDSKNKAVYFIKRTTTTLSPESMKENLFYGDLSYAPLDQFSALVEEVSHRAGHVNDC